MKKVAVFFADGTEEAEALVPVDLLRRAGAQVEIIGVGGKKPVGSHGITVMADKRLSAVKGEYDLLVLPGGMPGTLNLQKEEKIASMLREQVGRGGLCAAICAAPSILGALGLLAGKKAVCYPGFEDKLTGAVLQPDGVTVAWDGNVITAKGMGVATEFGLTLVMALYGKEKAEELGASVIAG
ncbi:MAG: DJ-1/PfpI family protein [Ruminococcus sp.]|nr:DJ-1/PfpI family protein [Candidatus Apopatosoma intestinale]